MGQSNWSGPVSSEGGFLVQPTGSNSYYIDVDPADGYLKIGGGSTVGSNVGLIVQSDGTVNVTADLDLSQVDLGDGTVGAPSLSFQSDDDTGIYRVGINHLGVSAGGVLQASWDGSTYQLGSSIEMRLDGGGVGSPGYSFTTDSDSGVYLAAANTVAISTGGAQAMSWDGSQNVSIPNGNVTMGASNSLVLNASAAPNVTISNDTSVGGLFVQGDSNGGFSDLYHTWRNGDATGSSDIQIWIEKVNTGAADFEALFMGYDFYNFASPVYNIGCDAGNSAGGLDPLVFSYGGVGVGVAAIMSIEDRTSLELTCGTLRGNDDATADANAADSITIRAANKTAGTGDGGDLVLSGGSSAGGTAGVVDVQSDMTLTAANLEINAKDADEVVLDLKAQSDGNTVRNRWTNADQNTHFALAASFTPGAELIKLDSTLDGSGNTVWTADRANSAFIIGGGYSLEIDANLDHDGSAIGFYGSTPVSQPTITGSRGGNAALANLLTALASQGLIVDSTTA